MGIELKLFGNGLDDSDLLVEIRGILERYRWILESNKESVVKKELYNGLEKLYYNYSMDSETILSNGSVSDSDKLLLEVENLIDIYKPIIEDNLDGIQDSIRVVERSSNYLNIDRVIDEPYNKDEVVDADVYDNDADDVQERIEDVKKEELEVKNIERFKNMYNKLVDIYNQYVDNVS